MILEEEVSKEMSLMILPSFLPEGTFKTITQSREFEERSQSMLEVWKAELWLIFAGHNTEEEETTQ